MLNILPAECRLAELIGVVEQHEGRREGEEFEIDVERLKPRTITTLINWLRSTGRHFNWPLTVDYAKPVAWVKPTGDE